MAIIIGHRYLQVWRNESVPRAWFLLWKEKLSAWFIFIHYYQSNRSNWLRRRWWWWWWSFFSFVFIFVPAVVIHSVSRFVVNIIIINVVEEILISFVKIIRWPINTSFFAVKEFKHSHDTHIHADQKEKEMKRAIWNKMDILWQRKNPFFNRTNSMWDREKKEANCLSYDT